MPQDSSEGTTDAHPRKKVFKALRHLAFLIAISAAGYLGMMRYTEVTTERTKTLLDSRMLTRFELRDATFSESVDAYRRALNETGINEKKLRVRVMDSALRNDTKTTEGRASITLNNPSLDVAAIYLVGQFDLDFSVHGKELRIHAKGDEPHFKRSYQLGSGFLAANWVALKPDGSYDAEEFLRKNGIPLQKGDWATADLKTGKLEVYLTRDGIDLLDSLIEGIGCYVGPPTWKEKVLDWLGLWP